MHNSHQPVEQQPQPRTRREVVPRLPPQEPLGTTGKAPPLRPPPGLEQVPAPPPGLGTTSKAPLVKAPPIAPPPKPAQPQPVAGPQQHRPVGKHYNPVRPRPQQAGAILQQAADTTDTEVDTHYCYNMTMQTKVLHFAVNEDKKEKLLQQELMLDHAVLLPSYHYHDDIERYDKDQLLKAMKKELDKLREKQMYEEVDSTTLSQDQLRRVVKTRWVVGDRPDPTTAADTTTGEVHASELRARFVAKGFSQHINDPLECYAATPSSTSLKGLLLLGILQGHQTTCLDINTAFINTPLPPTEPPIYAQPPAEWYYNSPTTLWRLKKAMYGLRTSPKLWQQHLGTTPTKSTTMQGRQMPLDYAWTRGTHLRGRLVTGGRDYKNTTVHNYLEGYFHVEACDYSFKGTRHPLSGEEATASRRQLHQYFFGAKLLGKHATTLQPTW